MSSEPFLNLARTILLLIKATVSVESLSVSILNSLQATTRREPGCLPLAFVKPMTNCKAAVSVTLDWGPHRVLSAGPAEPWFFSEVITPPPHPFPTWLGTGFGGFRT